MNTTKEQLKEESKQINQEISELVDDSPITPNGERIISIQKNEKVTKLLLKERGIKRALELLNGRQ